jgi:hypothetical protein
MTKAEREKYEETELLTKAILKLSGRKFRLDCGHHVTFGHFLGNNVTILNGKQPKIICSECSY